MVYYRVCIRKLISRLMVAVLLYVQAAVAVQACMMPAMAPHKAFSSESMSEPCGSLSKNKNACLAQCNAADQVVDSLQPAGHLASAPPPAMPAPFVAVAPVGEGPLQLGLDPQTDPATCIRYCRYLE